MELLPVEESRYLRARVYHFTCFCLCRAVDVVSGISFDDHSDGKSAYVSNTTKKDLLLVRVPLTYLVSKSKRTAFNASVGAGGGDVGLGVEFEGQTEMENLPLSEVPKARVVGPGSKRQAYTLQENCPMHLLICTIEDEPVSGFSTPVSTPSTAQFAPASGTGISSGQDQCDILTFYDGIDISGGQDVTVHQARIEGRNQGSRRVPVNSSSRRLVKEAMALAGLGEEEGQ